MDVVVSSVVAGDELQRIKGQSIAAVVVDGLDGAHSVEDHRLADCHAGQQICNTGTKGIKQKSFDRVIVKSAVGVGDIEAVVAVVE